MIYYVVLVATANLCLGYAVGVYLGFGLRAVGEMEIEMPSEHVSASPDAAESADQLLSASESVADDRSDADSEIAAEAALDTNDQSEARDKSDAETSIEEILSNRDIFHDQLVTMHDRLRAPDETFDEAMLADHIRDIKNIGAKYVKTTETDLHLLAERTKDREDVADICDSVYGSLEDYASFVQESQRELASIIDMSDNLEGSCEQLAQLSGRLINVGYELRDNLAEANIELARLEERLEQLGVEIPVDELTRITSREAAEADIEEFWQKDPHRQRDLTVAMIDLDEFERVNADYGTAVGDRLIKAVSQLVSAAAKSEERMARFRGQRFVALFPDNAPRHATAVVETIRQTIEETTFQHEGTEQKITASCAVSQCTADDTAESLFERLSKTLQEAKRYGRNRTFLDEGKYPAPVVPPNLNIKVQTVEI